VQTATTLEAALTTALADCPAAVIVDLTGCDVTMSAAIMVFASVLRRCEAQPPVPLLMIDPHARVWRAFGIALGPVTYHLTLAEALITIGNTRRRHEHIRIAFRQSLAAPGQGRAAVDAACERWGIGHLSENAQLVVSELVTNAVIHGGTEVTLDVTRRDAFLHVRVKDGSSQPPVVLAPSGLEPIDHGRGLPIVRDLCAGWGYVPDDRGDGKVVWATLRIHPGGPAAGGGDALATVVD
jgi:anti-sigma regulatory factor (Ser/Thr protein kinase)